MMMHIDPAHPGFTRLPRHEQARVYASLKWSLEDIADELGVKFATVATYLEPGAFEKKAAWRRAWKDTPAGRAKCREWNRTGKARRRARDKAILSPKTIMREAE